MRTFFFLASTDRLLRTGAQAHRRTGAQEPHHALLPHPQTRRLQQNPRIPNLYRRSLVRCGFNRGGPGAYTKEELASLHSQIVSNLEQAWELTAGSEDRLTGTMMQISQVVARPFKIKK